jgi:hypothetical protein
MQQFQNGDTGAICHFGTISQGRNDCLGTILDYYQIVVGISSISRKKVERMEAAHGLA